MKLFFANESSKQALRLLILGFLLGTGGCSKSSKLTKSQEPLKEEKVAKLRNEIPEKDCWNVAALYDSPLKWSEQLHQVKGAGKTPF